MYRLRSLRALLNEFNGEEGFNELENQEIYFAPYDELNDPMEGATEMFWRGDRIIWENFFRHYPLCLNYQFTMATLIGADFLSEKFPTMLSETFTHEGIIPLLQKIKERFFAREAIQGLLQYFSSRTTPIREEELAFYLKQMQCFAFSCVLSVHHEEGLYEHNPFLPILDKWDKLGEYASIWDSPPKNDDEYEIAYRYFNQVMEQQNITLRAAAAEVANDNDNRASTAYFLFDYPSVYLRNIKELVYPKWYTACFMDACTNAAVWSHYSDSHKGVCLIFRTTDNDGKASMPIESGIVIKAGNRQRKFVDRAFEKVEYSNNPQEVDFFRSLFNLIVVVAENEWYSNDAGEKSVCADALAKLDDGGREEYWEQIRRIQTTKTPDWACETEQRLVLFSPMVDYTEVSARKIKYNFSDLEGIIFGFRTPIDAQIEIRRIIAEKCRQAKRDDFNFYQARFDNRRHAMVFEKLQL